MKSRVNGAYKIEVAATGIFLLSSENVEYKLEMHLNEKRMHGARTESRKKLGQEDRWRNSSKTRIETGKIGLGGVVGSF